MYFACIRKRNFYYESGTFAEFTFNFQRSAHQICKAFYHRHTKSGSLRLRYTAVLSTCIIFANMLHKFLRHSDSIVCTAETIPVTRKAFHRQCNMPVYICIFDRIRYNIDNDLSQTFHIAKHNTVIFITYDSQMLFFLVYQRLQYLCALVHTVCRIKRFLLQFDGAMFQLVDIQDGIDQCQQIISFCCDVVQRILQSMWIILIFTRDLCHSENNI